MTNEFPFRFANWVRWSKSLGGFHGKTGSIEGNYRSPQTWEIVEPRGEAVDLLDAFLLNKVYSNLPERPRRVIKILHFRQHWKPRWQAQKLDCHYLELEEVNRIALRAFSRAVADYEEKADTPLHGLTVKPLLGGVIFT